MEHVMQNLIDQELGSDEIDQVAGGIPVPLIIAGGIFLAGLAVGAYNGYCEAGKKSAEKETTTGKHA
jgi:hypothetical protein